MGITRGDRAKLHQRSANGDRWGTTARALVEIVPEVVCRRETRPAHGAIGLPEEVVGKRHRGGAFLLEALG